MVPVDVRGRPRRAEMGRLDVELVLAAEGVGVDIPEHPEVGIPVEGGLNGYPVGVVFERDRIERGLHQIRPRDPQAGHLQPGAQVVAEEVGEGLSGEGRPGLPGELALYLRRNDELDGVKTRDQRRAEAIEPRLGGAGHGSRISRPSGRDDQAPGTRPLQACWRTINRRSHGPRLSRSWPSTLPERQMSFLG